MKLCTECPEGSLRLLFGPQCTEIGDQITRIRDAIEKYPSGLQFLREILDELPSLWPVISEAWPALDQVPGESGLAALAQLVNNELPASPLSERLNIILTPLTVMAHIAEFWNLQHVAAHPAFPPQSSVTSPAAVPTIIDTQGFCVGILAAIVVACSRDAREFQAVASNAIRLAVCIGALVDLDEMVSGEATSMAIRWESQESYDHLQHILTQDPNVYISCRTDANSVTITLPDQSAQWMKQQLSGFGLWSKQIPLRGRFHHREAHDTGVQHIMQLSIRDPRFQLPHSDTLLFPLRSNQDGEVIEPGTMLHTVALETILRARANWAKTVSSLLTNGQLEVDGSRLLSIGSREFVPRSARGRLVSQESLPIASRKHGLVNGQTAGVSAVPLVKEKDNVDPRPQNGQVPPIAITGIACRYAGADSVRELWDLLELGQCNVRRAPESRFRMSELQREPSGPFWGHFLQHPDVFDHRFFGISAREAESMDPQQRLLLQVAYEAMESAGYFGWQQTQLPQDIGCYVGVGSEDYTENVASRHANAFSATGTLQSFISGRTSHFFGWSGPSITIDTACSSAAVAIHLACKALQTKECSIAVAGGVNVLTNPRVYQNLAAASFLSPTGACKPFDAAADGYCRGEGAGLVVLRPLQDAIDHGDPILAVVAGSAVNQGSNKSPITVPDAQSQLTLYGKALSLAGVTPEQVTYVEAHGTGTQVGDPIELDSLRRAFGDRHRRQDLYVGSIKGNIGHTETSSGVAGLLKTILMLQNRRIPQQANFSTLNPKVVPLDHDRLIIPVESTEWEAERRLAMVSNYGASGSNAALVVREHITGANKQGDATSRYLLDVPILISAETQDSVRAYCGALRTALLSNSWSAITVQDLAYNLAIKQNRALSFNVAFPISSHSGLLGARLEAIATGASADILQKRPASEPPIILCFGGQSSQTACISKTLFDSCVLLQKHLVACEQVGQTLGLPSLFPTIFASDPITDVIHLHFLLFSIQYACAMAWLDSGLHVNRIVGHSFGQLTALSVAGTLSLRDGIYLIAERARLIQACWGPESGVMLAFEGPKTVLEEVLTQSGHGVDIACYNGPQQVILTGTEGSIRAVEELIAASISENNIRVRRLDVTHAFHSRLIDSITPGLTEVAGSLAYRKPAIPIEDCSVMGDWSTVTPTKIVEHSRQTVYFQRAVERVAQNLQGPAVWLEAGSASPIISMVRRVLENSSASHAYFKVDLSGRDAARNLATVTSGLWAQGIRVQFWPFHRLQSEAFSWLNVPPYQFAKTTHWVDFEPAALLPLGSSKISHAASRQPTGLLHQLSGGPDEFLFAVNTQDALYKTCTQGHAVLDQPLCPASMYMELVLRATTCLFPLDATWTPAMAHIENLVICSPLVLDPPGDVHVLLSPEGPSCSQMWSFSVSSNSETTHDKVTHAKGIVSLLRDHSRPVVCFHSIGRLVNHSRGQAIVEKPTSSGLKGSMVYSALRQMTNYADYFRGVKQVFADGCEAVGFVTMAPPTTKTTCNPILLDNFLQVAGIHVNCLSDRQEDTILVCNAIGEIFIDELLLRGDTEALPPSWKVYTNYARQSKSQISCDIYVKDSLTDGLVVAIMGVSFTGVSIRSLTRTLAKLNNNSFEDANPVAVCSVPPETQSPEEPLAHERATAKMDVDRDLAAVQGMFCDLFGVGINELPPATSLIDIGVDSLMSTEVLSEIKKRFQVNMSYSTLVGIPDIQSLAQHIFPERPKVSLSRPVGEETVPHGPDMSRTGPVVTVGADDKLSLDLVAYQCYEATRTAVSHTDDAHWTDFFHTVYPQQMMLITAYVVEAFRALGCPLESYQAGDVVPTISVVPHHEALRNHLYVILESVNLLCRTSEGKLVRTATPISPLSSQALHTQIRSEHPAYALEHDLLQITGPQLANCLSGQADGVSLIFRDSQTRRLIEDVYTHSPVFKSGNLYLERYLMDVIQGLGNSRLIKILEIGAGTGGTTKFLLEQLWNLSATTTHIQYTFTDISSSLVAAARKKFGKYNFVQYKTLDVEQEPPSSLHGQYDIVLSTNCIHATRNIVQSCSHIRTLLQPNGIVCLVELTRDIFWLDLVFGLLDGWWRFDDGRDHALASEQLWHQTLHQAGFEWVGWTDNQTLESNALRVIVGSPSGVPGFTQGLSTEPVKRETVVWACRGSLQLQADIYYPDEVDTLRTPRPIALMIHGGGHVMLSRKDIRPHQTEILVGAGFLPISIDYRLCPEVSLADGPMADVCDALRWVRCTLPNLPLLRPDIRPDGNRVVAVGWSTGGHLAMTLSWTAPAVRLAAPDAILAFYCPSDYEDSFWARPNFPFKQAVSPREMKYDVWEGVRASPIASYNPPPQQRALGGWMSASDPRSRIALHMNWTGQTLRMLINGWMQGQNTETIRDPTEEEIQAVSPHYQVRAGRYRTPTFLIHGTRDDLVPCTQTRSTYDVLVQHGVEAEIRVVEDAVHLFDIYPDFQGSEDARRAVDDGYEFLKRHVRL
ncbi:conidial yellow pigment biosynthesis polyketide synthase [Aspergillus udagawae]|uniref:Conidial yellow pigment biosynthesis polyketide synthase n=1 Tax=Aspergillus udagawae TaxID=91492 RepID=A0A8H3SBC4_9EURO|nr:type I iterative polyketide synthase [Aspergillus udagawae]GFF55249.1 conidial yellow pigment biosynthesis polyketide synthase [Aspergillus udagawae]GIC91335.1 type I iterative polyketide synthase [Aspergillus udagawae]